MNEHGVMKQIVDYLDGLSLDDGSGPEWSQGLYKEDLFKIFAASYQHQRIHGDRIWQYLQDQWVPQRKLTKEAKDTAWAICAAWSEWLYAWDKFPK